jgi:hypothetical protein
VPSRRRGLRTDAAINDGLLAILCHAVSPGAL